MAFRFARHIRIFAGLFVTATIGVGIAADCVSAQQTGPSPGSAKAIFGAVTLPTQGPPKSTGFYAKGCLSGAVALPTDGPTWQAMRLSRNRRWGRPEMISVIERLSRDAAKSDGWPGLLVGDISQPRGGPMFNGHASHQIGLDADIWLTPMPNHVMTPAEREALPFTTMLAKDKFLTVDPECLERFARKTADAGRELSAGAADFRQPGHQEEALRELDGRPREPRQAAPRIWA
jgi:penicillin-insensitive murein endopeptidase